MTPARSWALDRSKGFIMRHVIRAVLFSGALAIAAAAPAAAASTKDRVEALEKAVADLQARAPAAADSAVKINQLQEEIQQLTGRVEDLSHQLDLANARLDAISAALSGGASGAAMTAPGSPAASGGPVDLAGGDAIAAQIQQSGAGPAAGSAAPRASGDEAEIALPDDPNQAFDYASSFLLRGDYQGAQKAFELYLKRYPNQPRSADAQFRLGEIYLATGANANAADAFIAHIKKYPNDPHAAEAYLKLGTAFSRMQQPDQACKVFKSLKVKFPNASPAVLQRTDAEMARINCR
ncbi:MAG: tol-pal system protein YbgF [Alphaproteobacteria bacterium]|nr:tol-pal system protein YbgF [Alphaproteobacteria bacterium]